MDCLQEERKLMERNCKSLIDASSPLTLLPLFVPCLMTSALRAAERTRGARGKILFGPL